MVADGGGGWLCSLSLVPSRAALEQYQCIYFFFVKKFINLYKHYFTQSFIKKVLQ